MVRACRYSTPLWLFEKNNRRDSAPPPPKAWISQQKSPYTLKCNCSKAWLFKAFLCQVWRVWGVGNLHCHWLWISPSVFFHHQGLSLCNWWVQFAFSQERDDFPITSSTPLMKKQAPEGPQVTAPGAPDRCCPTQAPEPGGEGHEAESFHGS